MMTSEYEPQRSEMELAEKRWEMVEKQLTARGIRDSLVIKAFLDVPRHKFVPKEFIDSAYFDSPLPIGKEQTISQPYIVALMTELLELKGPERVLEVGTGSGYQAAILAEIGCEVYTIEIIEKLSWAARENLKPFGYNNVHFKVGDGHRGWEEHSPFDAIVVTAAPDQIPHSLVSQLKTGGKMVIPVGDINQDLLLITKKELGLDIKTITPVRFVPMTGDARQSGAE